jgi:hypothetical protein
MPPMRVSQDAYDQISSGYFFINVVIFDLSHGTHSVFNDPFGLYDFLRVRHQGSKEEALSVFERLHDEQIATEANIRIDGIL